MRYGWLLFFGLACGQDPVVTQSPTTPPVTSTSVPAPPPLGPKCQSLFDGLNKFCKDHPEEKLCKQKLRTSAPEAECEARRKEMIPIFKGMYGAAHWGVIDGEAELPQTFSPDTLPEGFVSKDDGFEEVRAPLASPYLGATAQSTFLFPQKLVSAGERIGFHLLFFRFASDMAFARQILVEKGGRFAVEKDNLLIVFPFVFSVSSGEHAKITTDIKGTLHTPPGALPLDVNIDDLLKLYEENEIKADSTYKGKYVQLFGDVGKVDRGFDGSPRLWLKGKGFSVRGVTCLFPKEKEKDLIDLESDSLAIIRGKVNGKNILEIEVSECSLVASGPPKK